MLQPHPGGTRSSVRVRDQIRSHVTYDDGAEMVCYVMYPIVGYPFM